MHTLQPQKQIQKHVFNLATADYITVREIVSLILNDLELSDTQVLYGKENLDGKEMFQL